MGFRVDARDVLDPNAKTQRGFRAQIVGHFCRTGPNAWDDYEYISLPEEESDVHAGLRVQLERWGAEFRLRKDGRVVRMRWVPGAEERQELEGKRPSLVRQYFTSTYLHDHDEKGGLGAAAVIAHELDK